MPQLRRCPHTEQLATRHHFPGTREHCCSAARANFNQIPFEYHSLTVDIWTFDLAFKEAFANDTNTNFVVSKTWEIRYGRAALLTKSNTVVVTAQKGNSQPGGTVLTLMIFCPLPHALRPWRRLHKWESPQCGTRQKQEIQQLLPCQRDAGNARPGSSHPELWSSACQPFASSRTTRVTSTGIRGGFHLAWGTGVFFKSDV